MIEEALPADPAAIRHISKVQPHVVSVVPVFLPVDVKIYLQLCAWFPQLMLQYPGILGPLLFIDESWLYLSWVHELLNMFLDDGKSACNPRGTIAFRGSGEKSTVSWIPNMVLILFGVLCRFTSHFSVCISKPNG